MSSGGTTDTPYSSSWLFSRAGMIKDSTSNFRNVIGLL